MKLSTRTIIIAILLSVVLLFVGFSLFEKYFELILPIIGNVKYFETNLGTGFRNSLLFSLTLAMIPIGTILIWRFGPILKTQRKILSVLIIVVTVITFVLIRREMIKAKARNLQSMSVVSYSNPGNAQNRTIELGIPLSTLNFEWFGIAGFIGGGIIAFFSLRQRE